MVSINGIDHINGTTSSTVGNVTTHMFRKPTHSLLIDNMSSSANLFASFDGGTTYKTIRPSDGLVVNIKFLANLKLKSDGASTSYEILNGFIYI